MIDPEFEIRMPNEPPVKCGYRQELPIRRIAWILLGAIIGASLGFWVSWIWNTHQGQKALNEKTDHWLRAVIDEINYNLQWGTDNPAASTTGDSAKFMTNLRTDALASFLVVSYDLEASIIPMVDSGRNLYEWARAVNVIVNQRNTLKNGYIFRNYNYHKRVLEIYHENVRLGLNNYRMLAIDYRGKLEEIQSKLKE